MTKIVMQIAEWEEEFLKEYRIQELLRKYCSFMPCNIYLNPKGDDPEKKKGKKKLSRYVFNDFELEKFRKNKSYKITGIQRYKGLGEMDAEQLWETTLDPESRILAQISISDTVDADEITTTLMSSNVPPRREFIMSEAKYANLDI